ncbi:alpha/beta hydrolase family protein [Ceratobasidium sp. AG-Ba]|nr:alpha/beta hydrolase family protein [Ceratobasidium sp. AG-Ba]QRW04867.1 alpha/beta hydrolase family protein [Ceratobasidium sp. AG-Ba]
MIMHPLGYESHTAHLPTGHYYRYVDIHPPQGTKTIATALVLHGFPDSAYTWRHQVKGWSNRGIRLIIPDALGYYGSSQPLDPKEYSFKKQCDNYQALIKHIGLPEDEKVILISHDWGAVTAMRLSQFKPDLVKGVASLCVPFTLAIPPTEYVSTEQFVKALPSFGYQLFFASPKSGPLIDANIERFMAILYTTAEQRESGERPSLEGVGEMEAWLESGSKAPNPGLLNKEEFDTIVSEMKAGIGFSAMLNHYRTRKINYELDKHLPKEYRPEIPKLLIVPTKDQALPAQMSANAETEFKNIEVARLDGLCGHWVQLEMPEKVEQVVGDWVERTAKQG